jgi:hydroxyacylglutathione hydrolase
MFFRQFLHEPLAAASYLIGCTAVGEAAVVDPALPAESYVLLAADKGLRITKVLETHLHADYVSTGRALAALTGAVIALPDRAEARFAHQRVADGEELHIGKVTIRAVHTPGHTPEHTSYLICDTPRATRPWFVLTGDCLFVGDVGRADLVDLPDTGPDPLYTSIFEHLLTLPDDVEIFPGHYGGSACGGKAMSGKVSSTIGFERRFNWALQTPDRATFAEWVSGTVRTAVADVLHNRQTNQGLLPLPDNYFATVAHVSAEALQRTQALGALQSGATLIDLRPRPDFAACHAAGALHIPAARDALRERVAALTAPGEALLLCAEYSLVAEGAAELLSTGTRNAVVGFLAATPTDWQDVGLPLLPLPTIDVDGLFAHVRGGGAVLDVRNSYEWEKGVIDDASCIAFAELRERLAELPADRPLAVVCESGTRASMAAALLQRNGFAHVIAVAPDGMSEYIARYGEKAA